MNRPRVCASATPALANVLVNVDPAGRRENGIGLMPGTKLAVICSGGASLAQSASVSREHSAAEPGRKTRSPG